MICPKCHTTSDLPANFCPNCGTSFQRSGGRILFITAALVLVIVIGVIGYVRYRFFPGDDKPYGTSSTLPQDMMYTGQSPDISETIHRQTRRSKNKTVSILRADLVLSDIASHELLNTPVAVLPSGWFALPRRSCLGGYTWQILLEDGRILEAEGGILDDNDPVGVWQIPVNYSGNNSELAPWNADQPLYWYPLDDQKVEVLKVTIRKVDYFNHFARIAIGNNAATPGIFIQEGNIVGWSFGEQLEGGYLWTGNPGSELIPEFYTDDFYRLTFADGREEALLLALSNQTLSDLKRLEAILEAYQLEPRLTEDEISDHIRPAVIYAVIDRLIDRIRAQGRAEDILPLFDYRTLLTLKHPFITSELVTIAQDLEEYEYARSLLATPGDLYAGGTQQDQERDTLLVTLYQNWLNQRVAEGDQNTAREVYEEANGRFPQDPVIHLAGVELALLGQDWGLAERLLSARRYPPELRDRVHRLKQQISDLKSQEGKIVIRFQPGARIIPVLARLDRNFNQRFIIDTGASLVTVPTVTARRLGLDLSDNLPRRLFYSATGVHSAIEVTLPYIEINGWQIENVNALVVDLPGQSGVGLLGMNYLKNFRMDINADEGLLLLEPR